MMIIMKVKMMMMIMIIIAATQRRGHIKPTCFENILSRLKTRSKRFLDKNSKDELIQPLIDSAKPSMTGHHSAVYKILEWTK